MPDGDHTFDPVDAGLADVARSGAREWDHEMAAWESEAEALRLRRRSLSNVFWEAMQRGDQVTITAAGHTFSGTLTAVRQDLAVLTGAQTRIAINVGTVDAVHLVPGAGGVVGDRSFGSFRAFLGMLEVESSVVRVLGRDVDVRGRVMVVAGDHVLLATGSTRSAVAVASIAAIVTV